MRSVIQPYIGAAGAASRLSVALLLLGGCGDDGSDLQQPVPTAVAAVTVTAADSSIEVGQTVQLTAVASDAEGNPLTDRTVDWSSADEAVATVSEEGLVTAVAEGSATITATVEDVPGTLVIAVRAVSPPPPPPPPPGAGSVGLEPVATGLEFPLGLTAPPGDSRLFVVLKGGTIRVIENGTLLPEPFLDLTGQVSGRAEQGLLGLAFPPDYAASGRFVVHYTDLAGDTRVSTFQVSDDPNRADTESELLVLGAQQPGPAHNGGQIAFGPDGMLYIALGDGGSRGGDDGGRAQSLADVLGAILRVQLGSGAGYTVPADNPFVGQDGARPEIWSYGLRNPWRFSFDRETGDLYIADVGETRQEEVNRAPAADGAGRGLNFGWSLMEGDACLVDGCDQSGLTLPMLTYDHGQGCSITGGYVYRGAAVPALQGQYLFADFCEGWVRGIAADDTGTPVDWPTLAPGDNITSFGEDSAGELYVLTAAGGVFKIVAR